MKDVTDNAFKERDMMTVKERKQIRDTVTGNTDEAIDHIVNGDTWNANRYLSMVCKLRRQIKFADFFYGQTSLLQYIEGCERDIRNAAKGIK